MIHPSHRRDILKLGGLVAAGLAAPGGAVASTVETDLSKELSMFAVIFEVNPYPERQQDYLDTAKALRAILDEIDGFDSIDRYDNRHRLGWLLSLSFWADEAALTEWRTREKHHFAQADGRERIFKDYRIRVAQVVSDDVPGEPTRRPQRRSAYNDLSRRKMCYMGFLEISPSVGDVLADDLAAVVGESEIMDSLYNKGKVIHLRVWDDEASAMAWRDTVVRAEAPPKAKTRLRVVEVQRDYTLMGRKQAPQYYPAVTRA